MVPGMRLRAYRNLRKGGFSFLNPKTRLVVGYSDDAWLSDVRFLVCLGGQRRAIREGARNVHAFVEGIFLEEPPEVDPQSLLSISYNPFRDSYFHDSVGQTWLTASWAYLFNGKLSAIA